MHPILRYRSHKNSPPAPSTLITLLVALVLALSALASSQMSSTANPLQQERTSTGFVYQGFLSEGVAGNTTPANGFYDFQFSLYSQLDGASNQVSSPISRSGIAVEDGIFSVQLDFGSASFGADTRYLEIRVRPANSGDFRTLTPRQEIMSVPYAIWADKVPWEGIVGAPDNIGGQANYTAGRGILIQGDAISVDPEVIQNRVTGECAAGSSIRVINRNGSVLCQQDTGGGEGGAQFAIGAGLVLDESTNTLGVSFAGNGNGSNAARSDHNHAGDDWQTDADTGLTVRTSSVDGIAFLGHATADPPEIGNRFAIGTYGLNNATSGRGVEGFVSSEAGFNIGTAGFTNSPDGTGVFGRSQAEGAGEFIDSGVGVYGISDTPDGSGVIGRALATEGRADGVWGRTSSPDGAGVRGSNDAGGLAGIFSGDVDITGDAAVTGNIAVDGDIEATGTITQSGAASRIEHPLDPANKYLFHSSVESPDMMNIYNGNVTLDEAGAAWVLMPEWFQALNMEFRYQLTPIGAPGPNLYIAQEIAENRFQIAGGTPGMKVSWQVTGIRNDVYARANRTPVEQEKPLSERGTYLYPELYGQPREVASPQTDEQGTESPLVQSTSAFTGTVSQ